MTLLRTLAAAPAPPHPTPSFQVFCSQVLPTYYQFSLADGQGCRAHWVLPLPLKHLAKGAMLLWQLPAASPPALLTCLDTGAVQLTPAHPGSLSCLRTDLREGVLRRNFSGQLLRGYFRLHYLPGGSGHLWQLIPIGQG